MSSSRDDGIISSRASKDQNHHRDRNGDDRYRNHRRDGKSDVRIDDDNIHEEKYDELVSLMSNADSEIFHRLRDRRRRRDDDNDDGGVGEGRRKFVIWGLTSYILRLVARLAYGDENVD